MSCPFYVSYDFAEGSRTIDVGSAGRITGAEKMGTVWLIPKDAIDFVFRYLQEETDWNILLKPNEKEWDAYCTGDNIVMLNLISEAPKCADEYHSMCIEQLLVDIVDEKSFKNLYSRSEEVTSINYRKENIEL